MPYFVLVAALACFLATMASGPFPGESATLVTQYTGLDPRFGFNSPIWGALVHLLASGPTGSFSLRLNILSAFCGAVCLALVYVLGADSRKRRMLEVGGQKAPESLLSMVAGITAVLVLGTCIGFWIAATRAHSACFDLLLTLGAFVALLGPNRTSRSNWFLLACLLWGLSIAESPTAVLLTPIFLITLLFKALKAGCLNLKFLSAGAALMLIGASTLFVHAWVFTRQPICEWLQLGSYSEVLLQMFRQYAHGISAGIPRSGWLTILIVCVVPWMLLVRFRDIPAPDERRPSYGSVILQVVLTALAILVIFNWRISPWCMTGAQPLLITPYVFLALWIGDLAGYWLNLLGYGGPREKGWRAKIRPILRAALLVAGAGIMATAVIRNARVVDSRAAQVVVEYVDAILEDAGSRELVFSDGALDDLLRIRAHELGRPLTLVSLSPAVQSRAYGRYVASLFAEPRLQSLARIGLDPLLKVLMTDSSMVSRIVTVASPDIWSLGGLNSLPLRTVYVGLSDRDALPSQGEIAARESFWTGVGGRIAEAQRRSPSSVAAPWHLWMQRQLGRLANNLGFLLDEKGQTGPALRLYEQALCSDTNNLSALINRRSIATREGLPEKDKFEQELAKALANPRSRASFWALSQVYGYIREPEAYASRGMAWALSGGIRQAQSDVQRALDLGASSTDLPSILGDLSVAEGSVEEGERIYLAALSKDPRSSRAVQGLIRISIQRGDLDAARRYLSRLEEIEGVTADVLITQARVDLLAGQAREAIPRLRKAAQLATGSSVPWILLATAAEIVKDDHLLKECTAKLEGQPRPDVQAYLLLARVKARAGNAAEARRQLELAVTRFPQTIQAWEMLIGLDLVQRMRDETQRHVEKLLTLDPANALANYILGGLQVSQGLYALAESSFSASLKARRSAEVLNDLAWVLHRRQAWDEALALAEESIRLNGRNPNTFDTLAMIQLGRGQLQEAEAALNKALTMRPNYAPYVLNMALLYEKKGLFKEASRLAEDLRLRPSELTPDSSEELRNLAVRLRAQL